MIDKNWKSVGRQPAPTFEGLGAKVLAIYTSYPMEWMGSLEGAVVIEFPDVATAKGWYESSAYQKAARRIPSYTLLMAV